MQETVTITYSHSPEETEQLGAKLAVFMETHPQFPSFLALYGDLGVGKTALIRGFASVYVPGAAVRSPTFALVNEYQNKSAKRSLFHFDMYRIENEDDLMSIGFYDYQDRPGVCMVEWSENIPFALPDRYLKITIQKIPRSVIGISLSSADLSDLPDREIRFELIENLP